MPSHNSSLYVQFWELQFTHVSVGFAFACFRHTNTYLYCVRDAVEKQCGSDAVAYQDKVTRLGFAPILEVLKCFGCDIEIGKIE